MSTHLSYSHIMLSCMQAFTNAIPYNHHIQDHMYHPFSFLCLTGRSSLLCISFVYTILISFMCTSTILSYTISHSFPLHTHCLFYRFFQSHYHISSCIMIIMPLQNVHASLNAILFSHSCHAINQV